MSLRPFINKIIEDDTYFYYEEKGERGCMCPKCHEITYITVANNYKCYKDSDELQPPSRMIHCKCGKTFINNSFEMLDPNIAEVISLLNKAGYTTEFCCEGHGLNEANEVSVPYIYFIKNFDGELQAKDLPENWIIEETYRYFSNNTKECQLSIYYDYVACDFDFNNYDKEEEMKELYKWDLNIYNSKTKG